MALPEALSALASATICGQRGRGVVRVEAGLREGVLVVVEDRRRDGEGEGPLHAVDLPVGEGPRQVVARRVLGGVHAGLHRQERAGVDGGLGALVLQLHGVGQLAAGEAGQVLLPGVVVARLGDQRDVHLGLRRVEGAGDPCSTVRLASEADSQKVMLTTPLWLASALRLQEGRLAAPAGALAPMAAPSRGAAERRDEQRGGGESGEAKGPHALFLAPGPPGPGAAPALEVYLTAPAVRLRTSCFWKIEEQDHQRHEGDDGAGE